MKDLSLRTTESENNRERGREKSVSVSFSVSHPCLYFCLSISWMDFRQRDLGSWKEWEDESGWRERKTVRMTAKERWENEGKREKQWRLWNQNDRKGGGRRGDTTSGKKKKFKNYRKKQKGTSEFLNTSTRQRYKLDVWFMLVIFVLWWKTWSECTLIEGEISDHRQQKCASLYQCRPHTPKNLQYHHSDKIKKTVQRSMMLIPCTYISYIIIQLSKHQISALLSLNSIPVLSSLCQCILGQKKQHSSDFGHETSQQSTILQKQLWKVTSFQVTSTCQMELDGAAVCHFCCLLVACCFLLETEFGEESLGGSDITGCVFCRDGWMKPVKPNLLSAAKLCVVYCFHGVW